MWWITDRSRSSRGRVSSLTSISRFLVWLDIVRMFLERKSDERTTLFALTSPGHHRSGLGSSRVHFFRKRGSGLWCLHHFCQSRSQVYTLPCYVFSTHSCSIHLVFLREQVTFYSLCVALFVRMVASLPTRLEMSQHEETTRTRAYASSCVCPARLPSKWLSFRCWGLIVSSRSEGKCPRQGNWLFDWWRQGCW